MKDYGRKSKFASFLPGIAGMKGVPLWCFYVNRGQGVVSFGSDNKDKAIMEFYPAHVAYQNVKRTGFRTFIRKDGAVFEPFLKESENQNMEIGMNTMSVCDDDVKEGIRTEVTYFILPEEKVGALVRRVTVTNTSDRTAGLEILDGMPSVIPYGVNEDSMKNMTQTAKAWMQVETTPAGASYYRVRASMADTAAVSAVIEGNYAVALDKDGNIIPMVTDPDAIFGYDCSLGVPVNFVEGGLKGVLDRHQNVSNLLPAAFAMKEITLAPGESYEITELIGHAGSMEMLDAFLGKKLDDAYFNGKLARAEKLVEDITSNIETHTADEMFDKYCTYTYMDNLLRGGFPIKLSNNKIFYLYSRKHGDLERDYNFFSTLPEFYSQGNGNFRDMNQNRRCDTFFASFVGRENIRMFYSLVQLDGYNPLSIDKTTYSLSEDKCNKLLEGTGIKAKDEIVKLTSKSFTPGKLYAKIAEELDDEATEKLFAAMIDEADSLVNSSFGEGYWSDHWDYDLDLIEDYLTVFPEQEEDMLYEKKYSYFQGQANILPRRQRYVETPAGVRQYNFLRKRENDISDDKLIHKDHGKGDILYVTLMEKLILLSSAKFAALDSYGMGVEMEGGKPGWYDALNGLPGLLGSSMCESYELARNLEYTIGALERYPKQVELLKEVADFVEKLDMANQKNNDPYALWNDRNDIKEAYRDLVFDGVSGETRQMSSKTLATILRGFKDTLDQGLARAAEYGQGICPTYFTFEVDEYTKDDKGILPTAMTAKMVPYFLEGPVRYLKLNDSKENKKKLYNNVKNSDLYDDVLKMYKVNASIMGASIELGRARAFTPGWLENESIWLHMEYKYLLEILKSGMYAEFAEDFHKACIPFLSEEVYGRSILENSSFIASSKNPDPTIHGKGFVARLSGSTIEFISMWKIMMFGQNPFCFEDGELVCRFRPVIPAYLVGEQRKVSAKFLGKTLVTYEMKSTKDYFPGEYSIESIELIAPNKNRALISGDSIKGDLANQLRNGDYQEVIVHIL